MALLAKIYEKIYKRPAPYYCYYSVWRIIVKPIRKWFNVVFIPNIPFSNLRVWCYRRCGYKIGKNVFIGMKCYLDDMCYDQIKIGDNVIISYGVYFSCHGAKQKHNNITIENNAYIGTRATIISPKDEGVVIGEYSIVGAMSLVNKNVPPNKVAVGVPIRILD